MRNKVLIRRWFNRFNKYILKAPVFPDDLERTRQAATLHPILLVLFLGASVYLASALVGDLAALPPAVGFVVPLMLGFVVLDWLARRRHPHVASWLLTIGLTVLMGYSAATTDGPRSPAYIVYVDVVLMSGLLLGTRGAILTGVWSCLFGLALMGAQAAGLANYTQSPPAPVVYWISVQLVTLIAVAVLMLTGRDIRAALGRATNEVVERGKVQSRLGFRLRLGELLADLSAGFMRADEPAAEELIWKMLDQLKHLLGARSVVMQSRNGPEAIRVPIWSTAYRGPKLSESILKELTGMSAWSTGLAHGLPVSIDLDSQAAIPALQLAAGDSGHAVAIPLTSTRATEGLLILVFDRQDQAPDEDVIGQCRAMAELALNSLQRIGVETALRQSLDKLEQTQQTNVELDHRYQALFRDSADAIYITESDGKIDEFNPAAYALFGASADVDLNLNAVDLYVNPEDRLKLLAILEAEGTVRDYPVQLRGLDGRVLECRLTTTARRDDQGRMSGTQGIIRDVTAERAQRQMLDFQVRRLEALNRIGQAITSSTDTRLTYDVLLTEVLRLLEVDAADVLEADQPSEMLTFEAGKGFRTQALQHSHLSFGESYAGKAARTRREVFVDELSPQSAFGASPHFADEGFVSYCGFPLVAKGRVCGVLEVFTRSRMEPSDAWWDTARAFTASAAVAIDSGRMVAELRRTNIDLVNAYDATLEGWAKAHDLRDHETVGHSKRVAEMTVQLAESLKVPSNELVHIARGALLHDIGKLGIPDAILHKPGPLDDGEWRLMRQHPVLAYELLKGIPHLGPAMDIPRFHHEHWDGTGYPDGLRGEAIPRAARIFAVVDVWDALRSDRPYRKAWETEKVLDYLKERQNTQFDTEVVKAFLGLADQFDRYYA